MYISHESEQETEKRLLQVIKTSAFAIMEGIYAFQEFPNDEFSQKVDMNALALVRDNNVWSQLVRVDSSDAELFAIFSFHFLPGLDNSGFVGWLASTIKRKTGAGIFVICGQNSEHGGIFDYWGCPVNIADLVYKEVLNLL